MLPTPLSEQLINLDAKILLVNTFIMGMATAAYIDWGKKRLWFIISGVPILGVFLLDLFFPLVLFTRSDMTNLSPTIGGIVLIPIWFILNLSLIRASWGGYRSAQLPMHGNRLLFWAMSLLVAVIGESLFFINRDILNIIGQIVRVIGLLGFAYAVYSHRIFDVRTRMRRITAFTMVALVSTLIGAAVIFLTLRITSQQPQTIRTGTIIFVSVVGLILYPRIYHFLERLLYRYFLGVEFDNNKILRSYSQAIARTLDVDQLSIVIIGTISELLETNRGSLMLLSRVGDNYNILPIPAMGRIPQEMETFAGDSLLI
jgi:hypothetical protein